MYGINKDDIPPRERLQRVLDRMKNGIEEGIREEVKGLVKTNFPGVGEFLDTPKKQVHVSAGHEYVAQDQENEEGEQEECEDEESEESEDPYSLSFEGRDAEDENLQLAAAAWRVLSRHEDDIVALHPNTGIAFFGSPDDFVEYAQQRDLVPKDNNANLTEVWDIYDDPIEIRKLDCDISAFKDLMSRISEEDDRNLEEARKQYEQFHWGDRSRTTGIVPIPGIAPDAQLYLLGVAREICYGAQKDTEFHEYYHTHGEESGTYPAIYGLGEHAYVVFGGRLRVSPRGIID